MILTSKGKPLKSNSITVHSQHILAPLCMMILLKKIKRRKCFSFAFYCPIFYALLMHMQQHRRACVCVC